MELAWRFSEGTSIEAGGEALAYVLSKNLKRRHLDESQRAMVAARLGRVRHGGDRSKPSIEGLPVERRAVARLHYPPLSLRFR